MNFKTNNSEQIGIKGIEKFTRMCEDRDINYSFASSKQDRIEHWDVIITYPNGNSYKIEVKGLKRVNRNDNNQQSEWICIEIKGITGYPGWIYGKADYIAFETENGFMLINRVKLVDYVENTVDILSEPLLSPRENKKLYTLYRRFGRKDKFIYFKKTDLEDIHNTVWIDYESKKNSI